MPSWTCSQMDQSWRFTRSQNPAASDGSKSGRASSAGWNRKSHRTVVRPAERGHRVKAATWSADRLSMRLGSTSSPKCRVRSASDRPGNGARRVVPVEVNVVAPERCGIPAAQSRSPPPRRNGRHQLAELRVDRPAVVALVVVLQDHLPVGGHVVAQPGPGSQVGQGVGGHPGRDLPQRRLEGVCGAGRGGRLEPGEHEPAPGGHVHPVQRQRGPVLAQPGQERCGAQRPVQPVGPGVIRASDRAREPPLATGPPAAAGHGWPPERRPAAGWPPSGPATGWPPSGPATGWPPGGGPRRLPVGGPAAGWQSMGRGTRREPRWRHRL